MLSPEGPARLVRLLLWLVIIIQIILRRLCNLVQVRILLYIGRFSFPNNRFLRTLTLVFCFFTLAPAIQLSLDLPMKIVRCCHIYGSVIASFRIYFWTNHLICFSLLMYFSCRFEQKVSKHSLFHFNTGMFCNSKCLKVI